MIVCSCNFITDTVIKARLSEESCPRTPLGVYRSLGCSPNCGRCFATVRTIIRESGSNAMGGSSAYDQGQETGAVACCLA
jgi:bacterioferritin-associated ferredoxin